MKVGGKHFRTIWLKPNDDRVLQLIDQRFLPHQFVIEEVRTVSQMAEAIREMHVRGAGLIGAAAAYGIYLATLESAGKAAGELDLTNAAKQLLATRPTAVNLSWAIDRQLKAVARARTSAEKIEAARQTATAIADEDAESCRRIGQHGLKLIEDIAAKKSGRPVKCN